MADRIYVPLQQYLQQLVPAGLFELPDIEALDHVWLEPPNVELDPFSFKTVLLIEGELVLGIPGLDAVQLVLAGTSGNSYFLLEFASTPTPHLRLGDVPIVLRFDEDILKPVRKVATTDGKLQWEKDPGRKTVDIVLARVSLIIDFDGNVRVETDLSIDLPPAMIGDSGVVLEAHGIQIYLDANSPPPGKAAGWRGVHIGTAKLYLPGDLAATVGTLSLTDAYIGNGGFSGTVADTWPTPLSTSLLGMTFSLKQVAITFVQNTFARSEITGTITLPFFDGPVDVTISINLDGSFACKLAKANGLFPLTKQGIVSLELDSIGFAVEQRVFKATISGKVQPLIGSPGLKWPRFEVSELSIDSKGNVQLAGGWINLPSQYSLDFNGFRIEIGKLGFGKGEDGGNWIGFSGGVKLCEGLPAGASVEGLRVTWYSDGSNRGPKVTFRGIGIEFSVPGVLEFKGAISYRDPYTLPITVGNQTGNETVERIDGSIRLALKSIDLEIDGKLVVGHASSNNLRPSYGFFAIYVGVELPAGIPLFSTGLGLYGFAGLFALQMEPNRRADEGWYENVDGSPGWYKRDEPGVTDLAKKWDPQLGSLAFGIGTTIGTMPDNGQSFHGKFLLVIVLPGPIVMLEGRGDLLKKRTEQNQSGGTHTTTTSEPLFRAIAVLDCRQGTFTVGLDVQYKYNNPGGKLLDIRASAETFFDFHDLSAWHIYVGRDKPEEYRVRAVLFSLFKANAYLMLQGKSPFLRTGAWIGYTFQAAYDPVSVDLQAFMRTDAVLSLKPPHFSGSMVLHGSLKVALFGWGLELLAEASVAADIFTLLHIELKLDLVAKLPWPLPSGEVHLKQEWGPTLDPPPLPLPLKELAVEHLKVTTSWPLRRNELLLPDYEEADDFLRADGSPSGPTVPAGLLAGDLSAIPVVPMDARPHLTFARPVNDDAMVGVNVQPGAGVWETIGDPEKKATSPVQARFGLESIALERHRGGGTWDLVASTLSTDPKKRLHGSWAPVPSMTGNGSGVDQTKLWIWSRNPFDFTRHTGGSWDESFTAQFPDYPCIPPAPSRTECMDVSGIDPASLPGGTWSSPDVPGLTITWRTTYGAVDPGEATVTLPPGTTGVTIKPGHSDIRRIRRCVDFRTYAVGTDSNPRVELGVTFLALLGSPRRLRPAASTAIVLSDGRAGLACGQELRVSLPRPSSKITLMVTENGTGFVEAFAADGVSLGGWPLPRGFVTFRVPAADVAKLVVRGNGETVLHEICCEWSEVTVIGSTATGTVVTTTSSTDGSISVVGSGLTSVTIRVDGQAGTAAGGGDSPRTNGLGEICVVLPPDASEIQRRQEMSKHLVDALATWSQEGPILEPHTVYRLTVVTTVEGKSKVPLNGWTSQGNGAAWGPKNQTQHAYFRTEGPPGLAQLAIPIDPSKPFESGLERLGRYVRQTTPPTVPPPGSPPVRPRPVYRAYDVGIEFNEDYVDLMYRKARRDLGLYLYSSNNQPVRDAEGRLLLLTNRWSTQEQLALSETDLRWVSLVNRSACARVDEAAIPRSKSLSSSDRGQVLDANTVYEARAIPLLLHEDFSAFASGTAATGSGGRIGDWEVVVQGATTNGPARWEVKQEGTPPTFFVAQTSGISDGSNAANDPNRLGTLLICVDPAQWTDYRLSVFVRATTGDGAMGVVFRYANAATYYRFSLDRARHTRRLVRVSGGVITILAEDDFTYRQNLDYLITVEAVGGALRIHQDGAPVFDVSDPSITSGGVGLYCSNNAGVCFKDVRIDDFSATASIVHSFQFTTSRFANFFHHLHSYQDETWTEVAPAAANVGTWLAQSVPVTAATRLGPVTDGENRAYEALASSVLAGRAHEEPVSLEVARVRQNADDLAFLLRSPEPIDWTRATLDVSRLARRLPAPRPPGAVKLTEVKTGSDASVSLLLREATNLTGHRLEQQRMAGPLAEDGGPAMFADDFSGADAGVLFWEDFGPNALDRYRIVKEQPPGSSTPLWRVANGRIEEIVDYRGGTPADDQWKRPGALAVVQSGDRWRNVRISATLQTGSQRDIGLVFRWRDENNHYRVSLVRFDAVRGSSIRRLVKKVNGVVTLLWEDETPHDTTRPSVLRVDAYGDRLVGSIDHRLMFDVVDPDVAQGSVGFYCWGNSQAFFERLQVESLEVDPALWRPSLDDLTGWTVVDEDGAVGGPSVWSASAGTMSQTSGILAHGGEWKELPGAAVDVAVGADGTAWVIGTNPVPGGFGIYRWTDGAWAPVVGGAVRVTVDHEGLPWVVNDSDQLYQGLPGGRWTQLPGAGKDLGASGAGSPIHVIGTTPAAGGFEVFYWDFTSWRSHQRGGMRIAVGPDGSPYVIDDANQIFVFRWRTNSWEQIQGTARDIGVGADGSIWVVRTDPQMGGFSVARWNGLSWEIEAGVGGVGIAVAPDGSPWIVTDTGKLLAWNGNIRHKPGTCLVGGRADWTDVELSVTLLSGADGAIGVMIRYLDADNYLRFSMDRGGNVRRLIKKVASQVQVLWEAPGSYSAGQPHDLAFIATGGWIEVHLDGTLLTRVYDGDLQHGRIALYCRANADAHFSRVSVRDPARRAGRWLICDDGELDGPSRWRLSGGELAQTTGIQDDDPAASMATLAVAGDPAWTGVRIRARLRSDGAGTIGLAFRHVDDGNYYRFSIDTAAQKQRLDKVRRRVITTLWEQHSDVKPGESVTFTIDAAGSRLVGHQGSALLFEVNDSAHPAGRVGLHACANPTARFEDIQVRTLPLAMSALFQDRFEKGDLSAWQIFDEEETTGSSKWSVVDGELRQTGNVGSSRRGHIEHGTMAVVRKARWTDVAVTATLRSSTAGAIGVVVRHTPEGHYRFVMNGKAGYRQLLKQTGRTVTVLWDDRTAYSPKQTHDITIVTTAATIRGYDNGVPMFRVVDRELTAGSVGLFCSANPTARFAHVFVYPIAFVADRWLFADSFGEADLGRWTFVDEGTQAGPSNWQVVKRELRQSSLIGDGSTDPAELSKPGTVALAGDKDGSDYRFSVRLRSGVSGAIGVVFRHQEANRYYRFSMDRSLGYRRLVKNIDGAVIVLWQDAVQLVADREYILTVDCEHDRLTGYLDGARLFQLHDGDLAKGRVGLYCCSNDSARFNDVRLAAPTWTSSYVFERERAVPAGTKVRLDAASLAERLPDDGVDLRLVAPDEEVGHERYFAPAAGYVHANVRALRNADGTCCVLSPAGGGALPAGDYRFQLTYARELLGSPTLSQAGEQSPEVVIIDVPWETNIP